MAQDAWAMERFLVDRTAPAVLTGFSAVPVLGDATRYDLKWDAAEVPAEASATVGYEFSYDFTPPVQTLDTTCTLQLPDLAGHTIRVHAVDAAGNAGPWSSLRVGTHTIATSVPLGHGTIAPAGSTAVADGASLTVTITPDAGYHIVDVSVDNVPRGAIKSYSFTNVTGNHTVSAAFAANPAPLYPVWRYLNHAPKTGNHILTPTPTPPAVLASRIGTYWLEGPAYWINPATNDKPVYKFQNIKGGYFIYTSEPAEIASIRATQSKYWTDRGPAGFSVSNTVGQRVYRFRNLTKQFYLYTGSEAERAGIDRRYWKEEGTSYRIAP